MSQICRQQEALDMINAGQNVFITGEAGSGKTHTVRRCITPRTLVAAPTGIASGHLGGMTCHQAFSLPVGVPSEKHVGKISRKFRELFCDDLIDRIVIDECSMLWSGYLHIMSENLKKARKTEKCMGGIQVVMLGDFLQLPVIVDSDMYKYQRMLKYRGSYCFQATEWKELDIKTVYLRKVYRQDNPKQVAMLNAIRVKDEKVVGKEGSRKELYKHAVDRINQLCYRPEETPEHVLKLCNYNVDADRFNKSYHDTVEGKEHLFKGVVTGKFSSESARVSKSFTIKEGSRVIILANHKDELYHNGDLGVFTGLDHEGNAMVVIDGERKPTKVEPFKWETTEVSRGVNCFNKVVTGSMVQHPIAIAKAISVHKSQGMTLKEVEIEVGDRGSFSPAQTYVALSRVEDFDNMYLSRPLSYKDIQVCRSAMKFYKSLEGV